MGVKLQHVNLGVTGNSAFCAAASFAQAMDTDLATAEALLSEHTDYTRQGGVTTTKFHNFLIAWGFTFEAKKVRLSGEYAESKLPARCILWFREHVAWYEHGTIYDPNTTTGREAGLRQTKGYWLPPQA